MPVLIWGAYVTRHKGAWPRRAAIVRTVADEVIE
jgi:hypothetical protein